MREHVRPGDNVPEAECDEQRKKRQLRPAQRGRDVCVCQALKEIGHNKFITTSRSFGAWAENANDHSAAAASGRCSVCIWPCSCDTSQSRAPDRASRLESDR